MRPACSAFSGLLKVAGKLRGKSRRKPSEFYSERIRHRKVRMRRLYLPVWALILYEGIEFAASMQFPASLIIPKRRFQQGPTGWKGCPPPALSFIFQFFLRLLSVEQTERCREDVNNTNGFQPQFDSRRAWNVTNSNGNEQNGF